MNLHVDVGRRPIACTVIGPAPTNFR